MPRVLRIINRLNLGGPTFNAALLTKHLAPEFETLLVAGTRQDSEESSAFIVSDLGLHFKEIPEMQRPIRPGKDFRAYRKIRQIIREYKPDIVHTHAAKAGALGRLAAWHEKVPVILHTFHGHVFHSYFNDLTTLAFLKIEQYLAERSDAIIAISERQKHELTEDYKVCEPEKVKVIPLGFDLSRFRIDQQAKRRSFREQYGLAESELAVGIIGRLVPVKNHELFLQAIVSLQREDIPSVRYFIIGDGEERERLLASALEKGLDHCFYPTQPKRSSITFTGWRRDVDVVMAGLDIVTLTSWNEGTPVSLIEAQAAGKPIVSTNVGGIENSVIDEKTALLVETGNAIEFGSALRRLIMDDTLRAAMQEEGWSFVKDRFHYTRLAKETAELYRELLARKSFKS